MRIIYIPAILLILSSITSVSFAQGPAKQTKQTSIVDENRFVRLSPAYAELLLRQTELKAEVESLLLDYTEEFPKVKDIRMELELLRSEADRLLAVKPSESQKLSEALGKLILGKVVNQTKLRQLRLQYADEHPSVKRQRKKVEVYEAAIKEILG